MSHLIANGRVVDVVFIFMVLELAALALRRWSTGRGLSVIDAVMLLLPGAFLLLALRTALVGGSAETIAAWLLASLAAHTGDLWRRHRQS